MAVDHLNRLDIDKLMRAVRREALATIQNAAIGRAGLRFYEGGRAVFMGGGGIDIQDGGFISINGTIDGDGNFIWDGTFTQRGPWEFVGNGEITGDTTMSGDVAITKDLDVSAKTRLRGETTLEDDLIVTNDGKIQVGNMVIEQTSNGGSVTFSNGATVHAQGQEIRVTSGLGSVALGDGGASLSYLGGAITADGGGFRLSLIRVPTVQVAGLPAGVLMHDPSGYIVRTST